MEIIKAKLAHRKVNLPKGKEPSAKVVNIMDALKRSLAEAKKKSAATKKRPAKKTRGKAA